MKEPRPCDTPREVRRGLSPRPIAGPLCSVGQDFGALFVACIAGDRVARLALLGATLLLSLPYLIFCRPEPYLSDDAYYYLLPAVSFWKEGFFSFDSITHSNGFHPLWMGMLLILSAPLVLVGATALLPFVALLTAFILVQFFAQTTFALLRKLGLNKTASFLAAFAVARATTVFQVSGFATALQFSGLETSVFLASIALFFFYLIRAAADEKSLHVITLATLSLFVLFARLDGGLLLLLAYTLCVPFFGLRRMISAGVLLTLCAAPYFVFNAINHGHLTPISGRVKHFWGDRYEMEIAGRPFGLSAECLRGEPGVKRIMPIVSTYLPRDIRTAAASIGLSRIEDKKPIASFGIGVMLLSLFHLYRNRSAVFRGISLFAVGCCLVMLLFYAIVTVFYTLSADRVWEWYAAPGVVWFALLIGISVGYSLPQKLRRTLGPVLLAAIVVSSLFGSFRDRLNAQREFPNNLNGVDVALGTWLSNNTPAEAVIGSWAAGEIAWNTSRPVIQLEGLIADDELLEYNRNNDLLPYFQKNGMSYLANFWREEYAPLPESILAPTETDRPLSTKIRYFWSLRLRPMIDCPEAFQVVYRYDAEDRRKTLGYVLSIDPKVVEEFLSRRAEWRRSMESCATITPAEDFLEREKCATVSNIRRTMSCSVSGRGLVYPVPPVAGGRFLLYARICDFNNKPGTISLVCGGQRLSVPVSPAPRWMMLKLTPEPVSLSGAPGECLISLPANVSMDELYWVTPDNAKPFEQIGADWWWGASGIEQEAQGKAE